MRADRWGRAKKVARIVLPLTIVGIIFLGVLPQFIEPGALAKADERLTALEWIVLIALALARVPLVGWRHRSALRGLSLRQATRGQLALAAVFLLGGATWLPPILLGAPFVLAWRRTLRREDAPATT